jgi:hypothetical protein
MARETFRGSVLERRPDFPAHRERLTLAEPDQAEPDQAEPDQAGMSWKAQVALNPTPSPADDRGIPLGRCI